MKKLFKRIIQHFQPDGGIVPQKEVPPVKFFPNEKINGLTVTFCIIDETKGKKKI